MFIHACNSFSYDCGEGSTCINQKNLGVKRKNVPPPPEETSTTQLDPNWCWWSYTIIPGHMQLL